MRSSACAVRIIYQIHTHVHIQSECKQKINVLAMRTKLILLMNFTTHAWNLNAKFKHHMYVSVNRFVHCFVDFSTTTQKHI